MIDIPYKHVVCYTQQSKTAMQKGVRVKLIQDITPANKLQFDTVVEKPIIKRLSTDKLMNELWERGVTIQEVFGRFYELEAIVDARYDEVFGSDEAGQHGRPQLTVADAELAGLASVPDQPIDRQPF